MKANVIYGALLVGLMVFILAIMFYVVPMFKKHIASATNQFQVHSPRPGIECLVVNSSDGVATSCYTVEE